MTDNYGLDLADLNLTPGEHTFRVKSRDNTGLHSDSDFSNTVAYTKLFPVQVNATHVECSVSNPDSMENNKTWLVKFVFIPEEGYRFPDNAVTVTGANISVWSKESGELFLNYATGNVSINVVAELTPPKLAAPVITLSNKNLSWNAVNGSVRYDLYANDVLKGYVDTNNEWHAAT